MTCNMHIKYSCYMLELVLLNIYEIFKVEPFNIMNHKSIFFFFYSSLRSIKKKFFLRKRIRRSNLLKNNKNVKY